MERCHGACISLDPESRQPQSEALKSLQEVLSWKASKEKQIYPLSSLNSGFVRPTEQRTKPYTLLCHDFKGGYLEDRYLQGGRKEDAYYFCRWECIDMFVYFSHHFVTVPPLGWVRAAHKHGTMMLGTVITEWDDGAAIWASVLASEDIQHQLVANLVDICKYHNFDGWLVNVENKIEENQVSALKSFVQLLTEESHWQLPGSKILWYDSVIQTGELKWQDQLNEENSMFFDVCDGIFLNYCWTPEKLAASKDVALKKHRPFDVFVGIDVFGRGCPGGGGFNTREALQHARDRKLSAAIFAPGWVLETLEKADFENNDCRFWAKLHDLCPLTESRGLPLSSAFCQGHGDAFFCLGKELTGRPWFNMSLQQRQPERTRVYGFKDPASMATQPSLNTCLSSAYLGGCSLELSAHLTRPLQTVSFRLFSIEAQLDQTLYCSYTFRDNSQAPCDIFLLLTFGSGLLTRRVVMGPEDNDSPDFEASLVSDPAAEVESGPAAKKARTEGGVVMGTEENQSRYFKTSLPSDPAAEVGSGPAAKKARTEGGVVMGTEENQSRYFKTSLPSDPAAEVGSGPAAKKARTEGGVEHAGLHASPLRGVELEALQSSPWFHDQDREAGSMTQLDQAPWITRHFRVDTSKLMVGGRSNVDTESISIAVSLSRPLNAQPSSSQGSNKDLHKDIERTSILLGHLQVFRDQDLKLQAPTVTDVQLETVESFVWENAESADTSSSGNTKENDGSSCEPCYILQWEVEGDTAVDYFNVYMRAGGKQSLVGHTASRCFVTSIADKFVDADKVTVTLQPVLSATGLPLVLSKCVSKALPLPKVS